MRWTSQILRSTRSNCGWRCGGMARTAIVALLAIVLVSVPTAPAPAGSLACRHPGSQRVLRHEIVRHIVNAEAARDDDGRIVVHRLNGADGGGQFEVAGINERYHAAAATALRALIEDGRYRRAEAEAVGYIAAYTDTLAQWAKSGAVAYILRDMTWNRGPTGAVRILQIALNVEVDGLFGPQTRRALMRAQDRPVKLIAALRVAREQYERRRRDESSPFWQGLVNRWNAASERALCYL